VERWFALLTEKQLRRGVHRSTKELETAIRAYIQSHNKDPKPLRLDQNRRSDTCLGSSLLYENFRLRTLG
jgi:hypothetical protein